MLIFYIVFFFLILRFTITLFNFISNPKLPSSPYRYTDLVSILIPVKNEESTILNLLNSIKEQEYATLEVLILDDNSSDNTFKICENFCTYDTRFSITRGRKLEDGWVDKNFACHQLAGAAKGKYLLFLDSHTIIQNGLISNSVHRIKQGKMALLSLFPNQIMVNLGERLVVPLMNFLLLNSLPLRLVRLVNNPLFSAASSQFMLFESSSYHVHHWHAQVKDKTLMDVEIMKLVKAYQYKAETLLANGFAVCRMYKGFSEALNDFSKALVPAFNYNIAGLICYLLLIMVGPVFIALYLNYSLLLFAVTLIILTRVMVSLQSGQNVLLNIIMHPFQMLTLVLAACIAVKKQIVKGSPDMGNTFGT